MNTTSGSRADAAPAARALIWDAPVRVFHWLMVLCFAGAWLSADSERWRLLHLTLGYTMAGLVCFRVVWGVIGTRHARFASFVKGPRSVARYLAALLRGRPERHAGHTPAGAVAIVALLLLTLAVTASGWAMLHASGGEWIEELHEAAANAMLAVVAVHVLAVVATSLLHRENLVRAMFTGRKTAPPAHAVHRAWRGVAALLLASVLGYWWLQWQGAPAAAIDRSVAAGKSADADDDHD
jgi:cytochrome b